MRGDYVCTATYRFACALFHHTGWNAKTCPIKSGKLCGTEGAAAHAYAFSPQMSSQHGTTKNYSNSRESVCVCVCAGLWKWGCPERLMREALYGRV